MEAKICFQEIEICENMLTFASLTKGMYEQNG